MSTPAFFTGSRVYGEPTAESDFDLVIYVDPEDHPTIDLLNELAFFHCDGEPVTAGYDSGDVCQFKIGDLNLLIFYDEREWRAWKETTEKMMAEGRTVERAEAKKRLKSAVRKSLRRITDARESDSQEFSSSSESGVGL